ncbi:MAG: hypothetical protein COT35_06140 [Nitrospirae bacterium CG08_land_8_20_14_0_20_52_24]|nr:MAG: hypothetical protein COT35_06140 [Nitrospirae bacterium CG08_land_8_20_14_0_20_52_24]
MDKNRKSLDGVRVKEIGFIFCLVAFAGVLRIPSLTQPLGPDQGIMAVIGQGILNGKLPYRDYWEMGSPAVFFTYALMFKLFGIRMVAIPITDILVSMLTTLLIYLLGRLVWNREAGYASALFFAFFSNGVRLGMHAGGDIAFGTFWYIAQRETFMLPLIVGSFYCILRAERGGKSLWMLGWSGFLSGLTFIYKFPSLLIFFCLLLYLNKAVLIPRVKERWDGLLIKNFVLISGFVLALAPFVLFFISQGAFHEMTDVIFKYVYSVYGNIEHNYLSIIKMALTRTFFIAQENFILWIFFIATSIYMIFNERSKENLLMVLWGLASVLFVISHREFFGYHYLMVFPPFSMLAGYGIIKALGPRINLREIFTEEPGKAFIIFAILANLVFFATLNYMHYTKFYYYVTGKISQEEYYAFFDAYPKHDYSFPADYEAARYIVNHTEETDRIFVLGGTESVIYFLSQRTSPSRFIFSWVLFSRTHGRVPQAETYRQELLTDLRRKSPKYIVTIRPLDTFEQFSDIYSFIRNHYLLEKKLQDDRFLYVDRKYEAGKI